MACGDREMQLVSNYWSPDVRTVASDRHSEYMSKIIQIHGYRAGLNKEVSAFIFETLYMISTRKNTK